MHNIRLHACIASNLKHIIALLCWMSVGDYADAQTAQSTIELRVTDARPVAAAVQDLVARYGYVITYEDPRYEYAGDLEDVTAQVRKDLNKYPSGNAPKVTVPSETTLTLQIPSSAFITTQDMATLLQRLTQAQSSTRQGGQFKVEQVANEFHVLPKSERNQNGNWVETGSVLENRISLPMKDRSRDGMINAICSAVTTAAHVKVGLGFSLGGISDPSRPKPYRLEAHDEMARDVLTRALNLIGTNQKLTWVLFYDPSENNNMYFLTIQEVPNLAFPPASTEDFKKSAGSSLSGTSVNPPK